MLSSPNEPKSADQIAEETLNTLKSIERESKKQTFYTRIAASGTIATMLLAIVALVAGFLAYQRIEVAMDDVMQEFEAFSVQLSSIDLSEMTDGISGMVDNIDALVTESRGSISAATEAMDAIDLDGLNGAIEDLQDVIEPLANFFNMF